MARRKGKHHRRKYVGLLKAGVGQQTLDKQGRFAVGGVLNSAAISAMHFGLTEAEFTEMALTIAWKTGRQVRESAKPGLSASEVEADARAFVATKWARAFQHYQRNPTKAPEVLAVETVQRTKVARVIRDDSTNGLSDRARAVLDHVIVVAESFGFHAAMAIPRDPAVEATGLSRWHVRAGFAELTDTGVIALVRKGTRTRDLTHGQRLAGERARASLWSLLPDGVPLTLPGAPGGVDHPGNTASRREEYSQSGIAPPSQSQEEYSQSEPLNTQEHQMNSLTAAVHPDDVPALMVLAAELAQKRQSAQPAEIRHLRAVENADG